MFSKQIGRSDQLADIFKKYQYKIVTKEHPRSYDTLRDAIDLEFTVQDKMRRRQQMEAGPTDGEAYAAYGTKSEKSLAGFCNQYMSKGACSRGDNCQYVHDAEKRAVARKDVEKDVVAIKGGNKTHLPNAQRLATTVEK